MKCTTMLKRLRRYGLIEIGLTWLILLMIPAAIQIVEGEAITTIGDAS